MPCAPNTKVKVNVPVRTEGEDASPGVKRGGFPWKVSKHLEVRCLGKDIPPEITIDVSSLDVGDKVFLRDLRLPEMVQVRVKDENIPILKIAGKAR
jgi:large subunit ribosomal protein L25